MCKKKSISSPHSNRSGIICNNFVSYSPSNINISKGDLVQYFFIAGRRTAGKLSSIGVGNLGPPLASHFS